MKISASLALLFVGTYLALDGLETLFGPLPIPTAFYGTIALTAALLCFFVAVKIMTCLKAPKD